MLKVAFIAAALALSACSTIAVPTSPGALAEGTALDEKAALAVEAAYQAARTAAELAVDAGWVGPGSAERLAVIDDKAFRAVQAVRDAYDAGNAASYDVLARRALPLIAELLTAAKGG